MSEFEYDFETDPNQMVFKKQGQREPTYKEEFGEYQRPVQRPQREPVRKNTIGFNGNRQRKSFEAVNNPKKYGKNEPTNAHKEVKHSVEPSFIRSIQAKRKMNVGSIGGFNNHKEELEDEITPNRNKKHTQTPSFIRGIIQAKSKMQGKILDFKRKRSL